MESEYALITNEDFEDIELSVKLPQYLNFVRKYGREPQNVSKVEEEKRLFCWLEYQNNLAKFGLLSEEQLTALNTKAAYKVDRSQIIKNLKKTFVLSRANSFEDLELKVKLPKFLNFLENNGRCPLIIKKQKDELWLACWQNYQNKLILEGLLTKNQQRVFEDSNIGNVFCEKEATWMEGFENYSKFVNNYKRLPYLSKEMKPGEYQLVRWFNAQIADKNKGKLTNEHLVLLESISFAFNKELSWDENFELCKNFLSENNRLPSHLRNKDNKTYSHEEKNLALWLKKQTSDGFKEKLSKEQIQKLENLGVVFPKHNETPEEHFVNMLQRYLVFKKKYNREPLLKTSYRLSNIDGDEKDEEQKVANWLRRQVAAYRNGVLKKERTELLLKAGLNFTETDNWNTFYNQVLCFMKENGRVPKFYGVSPSKSEKEDSLAGWLSYQTRMLYNGKLSKEHYKKLLRAKINISNKKEEEKQIADFFEHLEKNFCKKL